MRKLIRAAGTVFAAAALAVCIAPAAGAATATAAAPASAGPATSVDQPAWYPCYPYGCGPGYYPAPAPPAYYYPAPPTTAPATPTSVPGWTRTVGYWNCGPRSVRGSGARRAGTGDDVLRLVAVWQARRVEG
jgi:hypothetical protein